MEASSIAVHATKLVAANKVDEVIKVSTKFVTASFLSEQIKNIELIL